MQKNNGNKPRKLVRFARLTVLEIMGFLAIAGLIATWLLRHFIYS